MEINNLLKTDLILQGYSDDLFKDETSESFIDFLETLSAKKSDNLFYYIEKMLEDQNIQVISSKWTPGGNDKYYLEVNGEIYNPLANIYIKEGQLFREGMIIAIDSRILTVEIRSGFKTIPIKDFDSIKLFKKKEHH